MGNELTKLTKIFLESEDPQNGQTKVCSVKGRRQNSPVMLLKAAEVSGYVTNLQQPSWHESQP